ncbi:MAG TPA: CbiX/SirB N-terminal domain-containing protein [Propionicimonas sp.]|jgi:sirohydrochlorin ferrochelatase
MTGLPTLVACSHGTSSPIARQRMTGLADAVGRALPGTRVREMFVDVETPRLADSLPGVSGPVVVVPVFLSGGYHLHHDIHEAVNLHHDAVVTAPLGPDARLAELQARRLAELGTTADDVVVMAASASSDGRAVADITAAAELLRRRGHRVAGVGFVGGSGLQVADAVASARRRNRRVVVSSYLLMPGHFQSKVCKGGGDLTTPPLLGEDDPDILVRIIVERYRRAAAVRTAA